MNFFPSATKIGRVRIYNAWRLSGAKTLQIYAYDASDELQFGKTWYDLDWSNGYVDFLLQPLGLGPQTWSATQYYVEAITAWSGTNSVYLSELEMFEHSPLSIIPYPNIAISTSERIHVLNHDQAYNQLGYVLMELEEYDRAEKAIDTYIRLSPNIANPYDSKGDYYMNTGQLEKAFESYMKAFEIDSGFRISAKKAKKARYLIEKSEED